MLQYLVVIGKHTVTFIFCPISLTSLSIAIFVYSIFCTRQYYIDFVYIFNRHLNAMLISSIQGLHGAFLSFSAINDAWSYTCMASRPRPLIHELETYY